MLEERCDIGLMEFYTRCFKYCFESDVGFASEFASVKSRVFDEMTARNLLWQYGYVVLNAGMKNQVAERMWHRWLDSGCMSEVVAHQSKSRALGVALRKYEEWFERLKAAKDKLAVIASFPWMGEVTKYHLARNLGLDVAKPDRHLVRLAKHFGYGDVQKMCGDISRETGDRVGLVDLVLWRASNLGLKP